MRKTKASLGVVAVTMAAVAALFLLPAKREQPVRTAVIKKGSMAQTILLEGTVGYAGERLEVSLTGGRVEQVAVKKGQKVEKGQLLVLLDVKQEAQTLEKLQGEWNLLAQESADPAQKLAGLLKRQEVEKTILETEAMLKLKQIRAQESGIVGDVFCVEGQLVEAGQPLVSQHRGEMCVVVNAERSAAAGWTEGSPGRILLDGGERAAAFWQTGTLIQDGGTGKMYQQCFFSFEGTLPLGEKVTVEMENGRLEEAAMIPLDAMDGEGCIWTVEKGSLLQKEVTPLWLQGDQVGVEEDVAGAVVILEPEGQKLYPGRKAGETEGSNAP